MQRRLCKGWHMHTSVFILIAWCQYASHRSRPLHEFSSLMQEWRKRCKSTVKRDNLKNKVLYSIFGRKIVASKRALASFFFLIDPALFFNFTFSLFFFFCIHYGVFKISDFIFIVDGKPRASVFDSKGKLRSEVIAAKTCWLISLPCEIRWDW